MNIEFRSIERIKDDEIRAIVTDSLKNGIKKEGIGFSATNLDISSNIIATLLIFPSNSPSSYSAEQVKVTLLNYIKGVNHFSDIDQFVRDLEKQWEDTSRKNTINNYTYLSSINLPSDFPIEINKEITINECGFTFIDIFPSNFNRPSKDIRDSKNYQKIKINVQASSPEQAYYKAHKYLETKIAIWCLYYTQIMFSFQHEIPLNIFRLGEFHTVHEAGSGNLLLTYFEERFILDPPWELWFPQLRDIYQKSLKLEHDIYNTCYHEKLVDALLRFIKSANSTIHNYAFCEIWGAIEMLTTKENPVTFRAKKNEEGKKKKKTELNNHYSVTLRTLEILRLECLNELNESVIKFARIFRNLSVHTGENSDFIKSSCQRLMHVFLSVLEYHSKGGAVSFDDRLPEVEQNYGDYGIHKY